MLFQCCCCWRFGSASRETEREKSRRRRRQRDGWGMRGRRDRERQRQSGSRGRRESQRDFIVAQRFQRQLSHMSANRDGEWVKGIVGLFIDIKTTRFDCAETGEQSENRYRIKTFWETASVPSQMAKILLFVLFFFDGSGGNHRLKRSQRETTWERERKKESMTNRDTCLPT